MSIKSKIHLKVLTTEFEFISLFAAIALLSDTLWVMHDISTNGFSNSYAVILTGLIIATIGTVYICYRHHTKFFRIELRNKLEEGLKHAKLKTKRCKNK